MANVHRSSNKFLNIAGAATYIVKAAPGMLAGITVNKAVLSGVITIYDNASAASGTKIGTITHPATLLATQYWLDFKDLNFALGLTIQTSAADDITVVFR